jgi:hypothetical protein
MCFPVAWSFFGWLVVPFCIHKVHLLAVRDLEWDPLEMEDGEEILVKTLTLDEALAATKMDYRCDPEAALALWLYAGYKSQRTVT